LIAVFRTADVPMVAFARFIVVTHNTDGVCDERQPIFEPVDRTSHRPVDTPNNDFDKRPGV